MMNKDIDSTVFQIVYISSATFSLSDNELRNIEKVAIKNNSRVDVTGILMYRNGSFMQFLEGPETHVKQIFLKIKHDNRHKNIITLREGKISNRQFSDWSMKFTPLEEINIKSGFIFTKLFNFTEFTNEVLENAKMTMSLLLAFRNFELKC